MRRTILGLSLCSLGCSLSLACSDVTDTGNPERDIGGETDGGECEDTRTPIEVDAVSPLGFSAADVIALAQGTHTETLAWLDNEASQSSGSEPTELEVRIEFEEGARYVDSEPKPSGDGTLDEGGPDIGYESTCNDRLELDATLTLKTADGALDETVPVVVWAETARLAHADVSLDADNLTGSLQVSVEGPRGYELDGPPKLGIGVRVADVGFAGSVGVSATFRGDGGVAFGGGGAIAEWPENNPCDFGFPVPVEQSDNVQEALESFNGRGPLTLEYEPEATPSELSYALSASSETVCEELDAESAGELTFAANLELESADGTIETILPVQVTTGLEGGELYFVNASMAESSEEPGALLETRGIGASVDFAGYDYGQLSLSAQVYGGTLEGTLSVRGAIEADCLTNPPEPDPDANGSPGCRGTDFYDLWVARFNE
jgi:hypothetical protein